MKTSMIITTLILSFITTNAHATEYTFVSKLDRFTVNVEAGSVTFEGQKVSGDPFQFIKPLFEWSVEEECEKNNKPDLTIIRKGKKEDKRLIYFDAKMVADENGHCARVDGQGFYKLPIHRNWFTGPKSLTIGLGQGFSVWQGGTQLVAFKMTPQGFRNEAEGSFTNWSFFEKFKNAMTDFKIDFRVHPAAKVNGPEYEVRQGQRVFKFVRAGDREWAVQFPDSPWLAISMHFGVFDGMSAQSWISPHSKNLKILSDENADVSIRQAAFDKLKDSWSPDIKIVFHDILMNKQSPSEIKSDIANFLKYKPTNENFKVLVDALSSSDDGVLLEKITRILRVRNPRGPIITPDDSDSDVRMKTQDWKQWQKTLGD